MMEVETMARNEFLMFISVVIATALSTGALAGNIGKKFTDSVTPPPPPPVYLKRDFDTVRGSRFEFDSPQRHLKPQGGPPSFNGTPSVAVPLNPPFTSVGAIK